MATWTEITAGNTGKTQGPDIDPRYGVVSCLEFSGIAYRRNWILGIFLNGIRPYNSLATHRRMPPRRSIPRYGVSCLEFMYVYSVTIDNVIPGSN